MHSHSRMLFRALRKRTVLNVSDIQFPIGYVSIVRIWYGSLNLNSSIAADKIGRQFRLHISISNATINIPLTGTGYKCRRLASVFCRGTLSPLQDNQTHPYQYNNIHRHNSRCDNVHRRAARGVNQSTSGELTAALISSHRNRRLGSAITFGAIP
jgi:hypothetical protein